MIIAAPAKFNKASCLCQLMPQFFIKIFYSTIFLSEFFNHLLSKGIQRNLGVKLKKRYDQAIAA